MHRSGESWRSRVNDFARISSFVLYGTARRGVRAVATLSLDRPQTLIVFDNLAACELGYRTMQTKSDQLSTS